HTTCYRDWSSDVCSSDLGVLPDVHAHHRVLAFHDGAVLVGGGDDVELSRVRDQPRPARAEAAHARGRKLLFEGIEAAERALKGRSEERGVGKDGRAGCWK